MPPGLARSVAPPLGRDALYTFAVWTYGSREHAAEALAAASLADADSEARLATLVRGLLWKRSGPERDRLRRLDDVLRSDPTIPVTLAHPLVFKQARRLIVLQWELKRSCLMAVLAALPPMPRVVFVLRVLLGLDAARVAGICGASDDAIKVAWTRASLHLEDYLGPRCQHVDAANMCRCETRLGVALARGFIRYPEHEGEFPDTPVAGVTHHDVAALYAALPPVRSE